MLGKLFKYEFKAMGRIMLPLYLVMIFVAGLFSLNLKTGMSDSVQTLLQRVAIVVAILFVIAVIAAFVVMVILVVQRFYKNLLGTEGYLMFTLPVTTLQHIVSKALCALVWIVLGIVAGALAGFLMVGILSDVPEFLRELKLAWNTFIKANEGMALRILFTCLLMVLGILGALLKVYAAIAVGHQFNSHRLVFSIASYIGFGVIEVLVASLPFMEGFFRRGSYLIETTDAGAVVISGSGAGLPVMIVALCQICIYGLMTWYLLDRRLNLE